MSMTDQATKVAHAGLSAPATAGATSLSVELITGAWPAVPFTALLEDGTARKEQVSVTGVSGTTLTVTRAQGGTSAVAHDTGSAVEVITTLADLGFLETVLLAGADVPAHVAAADPHTGYVLDAGLAAHEADTTSIHGITNTAALATTTALSNHEADTTSIHGITDTSVLATATTLATAVSDHSADTTSVHGITDTAQVALKNAANVFTASQKIDDTPGTAELHLRTSAFALIKFLNSIGSASYSQIVGVSNGEIDIDFNMADVPGDLLFRSGSSNVERLRLKSDGPLEFPELAGDPDAPAANKVRLYAKDNGGGKTGLYARFPTGAVQQVALEP